MSVAAFYHPNRWRNRFGVKGRHYGPAGHRGHDIAAVAGTPVPVLRPGSVVLVGKSSILGWYVVVEVAQRVFDGYCHVVPTVNRGEWVTGTVGRVAGWGDYHGSAWEGPHLHMTTGPTTTSVHTGIVYDPAPIITAQLTALAADGMTRIEDEMTPEQEAKLDRLSEKIDRISPTVNALYDAMFTEAPTSRGTPRGVLGTLATLYDAMFMETPTSRGTPGGVLHTLKVLLGKNTN